MTDEGYDLDAAYQIDGPDGARCMDGDWASTQKGSGHPHKDDRRL